MKWSLIHVEIILIINLQRVRALTGNPTASRQRRRPEYTARQIQDRRKHGPQRKPKNYWKDPENLKREIVAFWADMGVDLPSNETSCVLVPNERLLMLQNRNDLRAAVASNGGRSNMNEYLGSARILPGKWNQAMESGEKEIDQLVALGKLPKKIPPRTDAVPNEESRWKHRSTRKAFGFWSKQVVVQELYVYVDQYQKQHGRPSTWMPRLSEMSLNGRDDLRQAIVRLGGSKTFCTLSGMVPHNEWFYFEGQLEMLQLLRSYLKKFRGADSATFPTGSEIQSNGYSKLYRLVQYYGGRKFVAARYGFAYYSPKQKPKTADAFSDMNWGPFDIEFAIQLLSFVREEHLLRQPPLRYPVLAMPSETRLLAEADEKGAQLLNGINEYGGYENVARRLGLVYY